MYVTRLASNPQTQSRFSATTWIIAKKEEEQLIIVKEGGVVVCNM